MSTKVKNSTQMRIEQSMIDRLTKSCLVVCGAVHPLVPRSGMETELAWGDVCKVLKDFGILQVHPLTKKLLVEQGWLEYRTRYGIVQVWLIYLN